MQCPAAVKAAMRSSRRPSRSARARAQARALEPGPSDLAATRSTAGEAGQARAISDCAFSTAAPDGRYTSFDSVHHVRVRPWLSHWHPEQHVWDAITSARLPGRPAGRNILHLVSGFPAPQAAVMRDHGRAPFRTIIVDLRPLNHDLAVLDVAADSTVIDAVRMLGPDCSPSELILALQQSRLSCRSNSQPIDITSRLPADIDVLTLSPETAPHVAVAAFQWQETWEDALHPVTNLQESPHSTGAALIPAGSEVYLSIDTVLGMRFRSRSAGWTSGRCCHDAVQSAHYIQRPYGRVLISTLPGLPRPRLLSSLLPLPLPFAPWLLISDPGARIPSLWTSLLASHGMKPCNLFPLCKCPQGCSLRWNMVHWPCKSMAPSQGLIHWFWVLPMWYHLLHSHPRSDVGAFLCVQHMQLHLPPAQLLQGPPPRLSHTATVGVANSPLPLQMLLLNVL